MMIRKSVLLAAVLFFVGSAFAQSSRDEVYTKTSAFGFRAGPIMGFQQWEGFEQGLLNNWHGMVFIESVAEDDAFNVFAQLGYHARGSALRNRRLFFTDGTSRDLNAQEFIFRNVVLSLGGKKKFADIGLNGRAYYLFGVRAEYNVNTNLHQYENQGFGTVLAFPTDTWVNPFVGGVIFGGGMDFKIGELIGATLNLSVNQDFTFQYRQPPIGNIPDPFNLGGQISIPERRIRNTTIELSVGLRFLRIVEYVD